MNSINVTGDLIKLQRSQSTWKCEIVMIFYSSRILSRVGKTANAQRILTAVAWFWFKRATLRGEAGILNRASMREFSVWFATCSGS